MVINTNPIFNKKNLNINSFLNYYNTEIDKKVTGWMYPLDLIVFYYLFSKVIQSNGDVCELGVAYGKSAIGLSLLKKSEDNLYLYDSFPAEITPEHAKNLVDTYGINENIIWNICDLYEKKYTEIPFKNKLKFLHIDAGHEHTQVLFDLSNFSRFVLDDGIISVDDFNDPEWPGINTSITEFILSDEGKDWRIFAIGQNKAYLCKKQNFYSMRNSLVENVISQIGGVPFAFHEIMTYNVVIFNSNRPMKYEEVLNFLQTEKRYD